MIFPVWGSMARAPEVKTNPLAMMAWFMRLAGVAGAFLEETGVRDMLLLVIEVVFYCQLI